MFDMAEQGYNIRLPPPSPSPTLSNNPVGKKAINKVPPPPQLFHIN